MHSFTKCQQASCICLGKSQFYGEGERLVFLEAAKCRGALVPVLAFCCRMQCAIRGGRFEDYCRL